MRVSNSIPRPCYQRVVDVVAAAAAIIQMPFKPYVPETYASREDLAATKFDHVFHFHSNDRFDNALKRRRPEEDPKGKQKMTLPLRPRNYNFDRLYPAAQESADDDYKFGSKRRASSAAKETPQPIDWISLLRADMDKGITSEPEYEIVERPEPATTSRDSESDSESSSFVKVEREEAASATLSIRNKAPAVAPNPNTAVDSDSESDWSLI